MKLHKLKFFLVFALIFSLVPAAVYASNSSVSIQQVSNVKQGGAVTISGTSTLEEVIIQVLRPDGDSTLYFDIVKVNEGQYSVAFTVPSSAAIGTYTVVAGQGEVVSTTTFNVTSSGGGTGGGGGTVNPDIDPIITVPGTDGNGTDEEAAAGIEVDTSKNTVTSTVGAEGQALAIVTQDAEALAAALSIAAEQSNQGTTSQVTIMYSNKPGEGVSFKLPAAVLAEAAKKNAGTIITLRTNNGEYHLPVSLLNYAAIATGLHESLSDVFIEISITSSDDELEEKIRAKARSINTGVVGRSVTYHIQAVGNSGVTLLNDFGLQYVTRTITVTLNAEPSRATVVLYDPSSNSFSFVPAVFTKQGDGSYQVSFKRPGNSTYAVIEGEKTFADIGTHWAKADIELLAAKQIVTGVTSDTFAPNAQITRAQFAALLVRALGLTSDAEAASFTDVKSTDWFAGEVGAAVKAGLVTGVTKDSFKPNVTITRQQMAVMVARAISVAKGQDIPQSSRDSLSKFTDSADISSWAVNAVAQAVDASIINGYTADTFAPSENATRAQATVLLKRLLQYVNFMN